jgi:hypothetical protein
MNELDIFQSTRENINKFLDFELFSTDEDLKQTERFMKVDDYLIHLSSESKDIFIDFDLAEAKIFENDDEDTQPIEVFEKIELSYIDLLSKINWYKEHVIKNILILFEEIYMHEDDIQRNIKKVEYLSKIQIILKKEQKELK